MSNEQGYNPWATPRSEIDPKNDPLSREEVSNMINTIAEEVILDLRKRGWTKDRFLKKMAKERLRTDKENIARRRAGLNKELVFADFFSRDDWRDLLTELTLWHIPAKKELQIKLETMERRSDYSVDEIANRIEAAILMKMNKLDENFQ